MTAALVFWAAVALAVALLVVLRRPRPDNDLRVEEFRARSRPATWSKFETVLAARTARLAARRAEAAARNVERTFEALRDEVGRAREAGRAAYEAGSAADAHGGDQALSAAFAAFGAGGRAYLASEAAERAARLHDDVTRRVLAGPPWEAA